MHLTNGSRGRRPASRSDDGLIAPFTGLSPIAMHISLSSKASAARPGKAAMRGGRAKPGCGYSGRCGRRRVSRLLGD